MLIRLRGIAGWSAPLLFAYVINRFSHDVAHIRPNCDLTFINSLETKLSDTLKFTWFLVDQQSPKYMWTASSEFGTYSLCEQRRFRRACASAQSRQNLRCSLIQAVSQEEPSDRKPDPWSLWMAGHAQLKFVMTECSKTQIRLTGPMLCTLSNCGSNKVLVNFVCSYFCF